VCRSRPGARAQVPGARRGPPAVAYQGAPGAYSEGAAVKAVPGCRPLPCEQFDTAFEALSQWQAERAVLPIENSLGGSIHAVYDLLIRCGALISQRVPMHALCCCRTSACAPAPAA